MFFGRELVFIVGILIAILFTHGTEATKAFLKSPTARPATWKYFGSSWKPSPLTNYDYAQTNCGGVEMNADEINSKCGICGDPLGGSQDNKSPDGKYIGSRTPTFIYRQGSVINVTIEVMEGVKNGNGGYYKFKVCDMTNKETETQQCFDENILKIAGNPNLSEIQVFPLSNDVNIPLQLPPGLICDSCTMQWIWVTEEANNCDETTKKCGVGYGPQPVFVNCADFRIIKKDEAFPDDFTWPEYNSDYISTDHGDNHDHVVDAHSGHSEVIWTPTPTLQADTTPTPTPQIITTPNHIPSIVIPGKTTNPGGHTIDTSNESVDKTTTKKPKLPKTSKLAVPVVAPLVPAIGGAAAATGLTAAGLWPLGLLLGLGLLQNAGAGTLQGTSTNLITQPHFVMANNERMPTAFGARQMQPVQFLPSNRQIVPQSRIELQPIVPIEQVQVVPVQQTVPVQPVVPVQFGTLPQVAQPQQVVPVPVNSIPVPIQLQPLPNGVPMDPASFVASQQNFPVNIQPVAERFYASQRGPVVGGAQNIQTTNLGFGQNANSAYNTLNGNSQLQGSMSSNSFRTGNRNVGLSQFGMQQAMKSANNKSAFFELPENHKMQIEFDREPAIMASREFRKNLNVNSISPYSTKCPREMQSCKPRYREKHSTIYGSFSILSMICELECADGKNNCPQYLCICTCDIGTSFPTKMSRGNPAISSIREGMSSAINANNLQGAKVIENTTGGKNNQRSAPGKIGSVKDDVTIIPVVGPNKSSVIPAGTNTNRRGDGILS